MRTKGKISKVAICPICGGFILACHIDHQEEETREQFDEFLAEGFEIKIETAEETRSRKFIDYEKCKKHIKNE